MKDLRLTADEAAFLDRLLEAGVEVDLEAWAELAKRLDRLDAQRAADPHGILYAR